MESFASGDRDQSANPSPPGEDLRPPSFAPSEDAPHHQLEQRLRDAGVTEQTTPDGQQFILPPRSGAGIRIASIFFIVFGLIFAGFPAGGIFSMAQGINQMPNASPFGYIALLFALPFVLVGLGLAALGLAGLIGTRTAVTLSRYEIIAAESFPLYTWRRRFPLDGLTQLQISKATSTTAGQPTKELKNWSTLIARYDARKDRLLAFAYPTTTLQALADVLADRVEHLQAPSLVSGDRKSIQVVTAAAGVDVNEQIEQEKPLPPDQLIADYDQRDDGFTVTYPSRGFFKGSFGLGFFAVIWTAFSLVIAVPFAFGAAQAPSAGATLLAILLPGIFPLIGVGMLVLAYRLGQRSAIIDVIAPASPAAVLLLTHRGAFKTRQYEWRAADIEAIREGPSGVEVNDRPVYELQIHPVAGKKVGLLSGVKRRELDWLARLLRWAVQSPASTADNPIAFDTDDND